VQLIATALFTNGGTSNLSSQVTWSSSQPSVASVSSGNAFGLTPGSTTITATLGSVTNTFNLVVTNATVQSIVVTPTGQTIAPNSTLHFTATGLFSDGSSQTITRNVAWASDNASAATVGNSSGNVGVATAVASGSANISATMAGVTGSALLTVSTATLDSISLTPITTPEAPAVVAPAATFQFIPVGTYSDGSTQNLSAVVVWTSSAPTVASVNSGLVTGQSAGSATITATQGSVSASANVVVESSAPTSITITTNNLTSPNLPVGIVGHYIATGVFSDGLQDLTNSVAWTCSPASVATISNASGSEGFATGVSVGDATISASFAGVVGNSDLTVTDATLVSIAISPTTDNLAVGSSLQFTATGSFSDGSTINLTQQVEWTSSNTQIALVNVGLVTGASAGNATITAALNGVTATTALTVQ
jgi:uncharacterized protein YjdB